MPKRQSKMHTVTSQDGSKIAFWQSGRGSPLLLVHGATADHSTTWRFVLSGLEKHFTVYAMDRRGRGGSGDALPYDLQREAEDVAAVVDAIGESVSLLGHSYGALCGLEAALLTSKLQRLVLYEGVPLRGADDFKPGVIEKMQSMLKAGELEGVLLTMYRELVEMTPEEVELLRSQHDAWETRLRNAPTLPRELSALERYVFEPERYKDMPVPTLLLVGGDSPAREHTYAQAVEAALQDARIVTMPGQQHAAMYTAPELFVGEVVRFLST